MKQIINIVILCASLLIFSCKEATVKIDNHLQIEFDGYKDDFYKKYNLILDIKSDKAVSNMLELHEESKEVHFCRLKPVMWKINVYRGPKENRDLLFGINSNTDDEIYVVEGYNCFDNPLLIQTLTRLLRVDKIREYNGRLDQANFMKIITSDSLHKEKRIE